MDDAIVPTATGWYRRHLAGPIAFVAGAALGSALMSGRSPFGFLSTVAFGGSLFLTVIALGWALSGVRGAASGFALGACFGHLIVWFALCVMLSSEAIRARDFLDAGTFMLIFATPMSLLAWTVIRKVERQRRPRSDD